MAKKETAFFCQNCGYESAKWLGQCPGCHEVASFVEEPAKILKTGSVRKSALTNPPVYLKDVSKEKEDRVSTGLKELDRVLGGGIVKGSLVLIGGDPGIGKSTLLLQVTRELSLSNHKVLYVSGEESLRQIKLRADRIGSDYKDMLLMCETNLDDIQNAILDTKPEVVVIDSIQTMYRDDVSSAPGSVSQVREATSLLLQLAKSQEISIFIVGHVTKEGAVAGPRVLEHMVDTVLYFEGDRHNTYRILRGVKNRFGSTDEIGVFEMESAGLREVANPSEFLLEGRAENASGSVVSCAIEGTRPMMVEVQALLCKSAFGLPRRQATGMDYNRVNLLMAVIEKRGGLQIGDQDAYVNVAGGLKISEPSMDLATAMAIISAYKNQPIDPKTVIFGEIGLSGEIRGVTQAEQRVKEAIKLGFNNCILPKVNITDNIRKLKGIELIGVSSLAEAKDRL